MYGLTVPYSCVYQAKEHVLKLIHGTHEETYAEIPKFCEELLAANPGSFIEFEATPTNQFCHLSNGLQSGPDQGFKFGQNR